MKLATTLASGIYLTCLSHLFASTGPTYSDEMHKVQSKVGDRAPTHPHSELAILFQDKLLRQGVRTTIVEGSDFDATICSAFAKQNFRPYFTSSNEKNHYYHELEAGNPQIFEVAARLPSGDTSLAYCIETKDGILPTTLQILP